MITPAKARTVAIIAVTFGSTIFNSHAACNAPNNQGSYTIAITGGKASVQDGESSTYTCTMTPSVSSVTPTWSLNPTGGGGYGLKPPKITTSGNDATVEFFWHAANPTSFSCTYELICQTSPDCIVKKTITASVPSGIWGETFYYAFLQLNRQAQATPGVYHITGTRYSTTLNNNIPKNPVYMLHNNSQFMPKTIAHEGVHVTDVTGGSTATAALQGVIFGDSYLNANNLMNTDYTLAQINGIRSLVDIYITRQLIGPSGNSTSWMELRAYAVSDIMNPKYFTRNTHP